MLRLACMALFLLTLGANAQAQTITVPATQQGNQFVAACPAGLVMTGFILSVGSNCSGTCGQGQHSVGGFSIQCSPVRR